MLAVLVVVLAVGGVYMQSLGGPFLWDDRLLVLDAPLVEKSAALADYFRQPFWMGAGAQLRDVSYYRPLVTLSFALDHRLHGTNSGGYHLTNLVLHLGCALSLLAVLKRAGVRAPVAALLTCAWALQPRLAEAAAWISGRTDLLATLFVLAALLAWGPSLGRRVTAALLFGLGLLAKESAVALPLALVASEWWRAPSGARSLRRVATSVFPLLFVLGVYVAFRLFVVGYPDRQTTLGPLRRVLTVLQAFGTYLTALADPFRPRAVIGRVGALGMPMVLVGGLGLVLAVVALVRGRARLSADAVRGLVLAAGALLPVLHVVPIPLRTLAADRFLYLPTVGLVMAAAPLLDRWLAEVRFRWAAGVGVVGALGFVTFGRVGVWSDELEFWVRTYLETPPTNNAPATELFGVYYRAGLYADGVTLTERALRYDDPNQADADFNHALCLTRLGRRQEAAEGFRAVRSRHRSHTDVDVELALIEMQTGRSEEARRRLEAVARAGDVRGRLLLSRLPELVQARAALVALAPDAPAERRARLATSIGDDPTALRAWTEVTRVPATPKAVLVEGLRYLVNTGDLAAIEGAARAHLARFGAIEPELAAIVELRLTELARLIATRSRVGLGRPALELSGAPRP